MISLASGILPEFGAVDVVHAASCAGYDAVGLWVDPAEWTPATTIAVNRRLADANLRVLDVEVVWIKPGPLDPAHLTIIDIGLELGARNLLVVSSDPDEAATQAKFAALCDHAGVSGLRVALEFGMFTDVKTIQQAHRIVAGVGHGAAALLVDPIHLDRSGGTADDVAAIPPAYLPYAQLCDAAPCTFDTADFDAVIRDAVDERRQLGQGCLPLPAIIAALPAQTPYSIELRSSALRNQFADPVERAAAVLDATRSYLATIS
ncbi:MAG: sugar phosphate isomerase/epimerase family protein [Sphingopyxis sp.]